MADLYAIVGVAKLKTIGNIEGVKAHMMRTRPTANSNGKENIILIAPPTKKELQQDIAAYMPRKNAVLAIDFLTAASPSFFEGKTEEQIRQWAEASLEWTQGFFGKDNVIAAVLHMDESQPHVQYILRPEWEGKLNAAHYINGKKKMRELWTSYAKAMAPFGLKRGREYSPAEHKSIRAYYADVKAGKQKAAAVKVRASQLPEPTIEDRLHPREYAAALINKALQYLARENGNLRAALEAERADKEKLTAATTKDRQLYHRAHEHPEEIKALLLDLENARRAIKENNTKFNSLAAAVKEFFKKNIPVNSVMRKPENVGALASFPEIAEDVRLTLLAEHSQREGMERSR